MTGFPSGTVAGRPPPIVSIVVPTRNESGSIDRCLLALLDQDFDRTGLEIIVVDGDSADDTVARVERIASDNPRVRLLRNPERITPVAFNRGLLAARGQILGIMSAHARPAPDYVRRAVASLEATGAWGVGGRIERSAEGPVQQAIATVTSSPFGVGNAVHNYGRTAQYVETAFPGMWPRGVFERVGLFDEELERDQDDELSHRIRAAGGKIWFDPEIVIGYTPRGTWRSFFGQYRQYAMWKVRVFQKHPSAARPRHLVPPGFVGLLAIGPLTFPLGAGGPLAAGAALVIYAAAVTVASGRLSSGGARPWLIARALVTLHLAYGMGFWEGVIRFAPRWIVARRGEVPQLALADQTNDGPARETRVDEARRGAVLARTAATYADYHQSGRARRWSTASPGMQTAIRDRDAWIARSIEPGVAGTVVDLGCGDGALGVLLESTRLRPLRLVGIDILNERLEQARTRVPWAEFHQTGADAIPLEDRSASVVVALTLFSSVTDRWMLGRIVTEIDRVLAPGGRLLVYDIRYPSPGNRQVRAISPGDLRWWFAGWAFRHETITLLPPIARSPLGGGEARYRALHAVSFLRSHVAAVIEKPS